MALSRCVLIGNLGRGSFSSVDLYVDLKTDYHVAVKTALCRKDDEYITREASVLQLLEHKNLPRVVYYSKIPHPMLGLEYIPGPSLFDVIYMEYISMFRLKHIFYQLFKALDYLDKHNVVHHDIKPENILLGPQDRVVLIDFGFSRKLPSKRMILEDRHSINGTPEYIAPELLYPDPIVGSCNDVWSAGITLFVTVAGVFPYTDAEEGYIIEHMDVVANMEIDYSDIILDNPQVYDFLRYHILVPYTHRRSPAEILLTQWFTDSPSIEDFDPIM